MSIVQQRVPCSPLFSAREWASAENIALFVVCIADLISTLYWVHAGVAHEANPLFNAWLGRGDAAFIGMKFLTFLPLITVSTYYRRQRPRLIAWAMRATIAGYLLLYAAHILTQFVTN